MTPELLNNPINTNFNLREFKKDGDEDNNMPSFIDKYC